VITGIAAGAWFKISRAGVVIGLAMLCNLIAGALGGILIPMCWSGCAPIRRGVRTFRPRRSPTWSASFSLSRHRDAVVGLN